MENLLKTCEGKGVGVKPSAVKRKFIGKARALAKGKSQPKAAESRPKAAALQPKAVAVKPEAVAVAQRQMLLQLCQRQMLLLSPLLLQFSR